MNKLFNKQLPNKMGGFVPHSRPMLDEMEIDAVKTLILSGQLNTGFHVESFRSSLAVFMGVDVQQVTLASSGSHALRIILKSMGLQSQDEVILPNYVCDSVYNSILKVGLKPILCDIGEFWSMTTKTVSEKISSKTKAIILVAIYGIEIDIKAFKKFNIPLIYDACQNFSTLLGADPAIKDADFSFYSFHPTKCLTAGGGGAVHCRSDLIGSIEDTFKNKYEDCQFFSDIGACIGMQQLNRYKFMQEKRNFYAQMYFESLPIRLTEKLQTLKSNYFRFVIRQGVYDFSYVAKMFEEKGIIVRRGVDTILGPSNLCPNAEIAFNETVSLPIYPALTISQINLIISVAINLWRHD
jgi:perosamine synthetase